MNQSPTTALETIQSRVQKRLDDEWVQHLIDRVVSYHCRKGTRGECDCSYCERKNKLSVQAGDFLSLWREYYRRFHNNVEADIHYWTRDDQHYYKTYAVDSMREIVKEEAKVELERLRQDVLYQ